MNASIVLKRLFNYIRPNSLTREIVKAGIIFASLQGLSLGLGYGLQIFLVRWLGAIEYGWYCYALSWSALFGALATLGLPAATLKFIPEYVSSRNWELFNGFLSKGRLWILVFGVISAVIVSIVLFFVFPEANRYCLIIGAWIVPAGALTAFYNETLRSMHKIISANLLPQLGLPIFLIVAIGCFVNGHKSFSAVDALFLTLSGHLAILCFQYWIVSRSRPKESRDFGEKLKTRDWISVSLPLLAIGLFHLMMGQADILVIGSIMGPKYAGIYSISAKIAGLVSFVLIAINTLAAPVYASLYAKGNIMEMQNIASRLSHIMFWPSLGVSCIILMFSSRILQLFGSEFTQGETALQILVIGHLVNVGTGSIGYLTDLTGLQYQGAIIRGVGAMMNVIFTIVLVPSTGMTGAAAVTSGCLIFWNLCLYRLVSSKHGINPTIWHACRRRR